MLRRRKHARPLRRLDRVFALRQNRGNRLTP